MSAGRFRLRRAAAGLRLCRFHCDSYRHAAHAPARSATRPKRRGGLWGLEQIELLGCRLWRTEMLGRGLDAGQVEAEPLASDFKSTADHPGDRARAGHALAPGRIVVLAAAGVADQLEDVLHAVGEILGQPFPE